MPKLWSTVWILPSPKVEMKSVPLVGLMSKQRFHKLKTRWKKCFWQALLTYCRVTFRYQMDSSRSWHWTSVLLITLLWVGSADQRERESHIMIVLFIQQGNLGQQTDHPVSEKSQVLPDKIIWIHSSISNQHQSCQLDVELIKMALIQNTKQNYYLVKCYLILLLGYVIITSKTHIHKLFQLQSEKCTQLKNASGYRWSFNWIIKINTWY